METIHYWAQDSSEALEHHGVLGQKWGVRRYQNEDGTLTAEGKRRLEQEKLKIERENDRKLLAVTGRHTPNKYGGNLSNRELREATSRLKIENDYRKELLLSKTGAKKISKEDIESNPLAKTATTLLGAATGTALAVATAAIVQATTPVMKKVISDIPKYTSQAFNSIFNKAATTTSSEILSTALTVIR